MGLCLFPSRPLRHWLRWCLYLSQRSLHNRYPLLKPYQLLLPTRLRSPYRCCRLQSRYHSKWNQRPPGVSSLVRNLRRLSKSLRCSNPSYRQHANACRVPPLRHQQGVSPGPVHRPVRPTNPWGVLAADLPEHHQRQPREFPSVLVLLKERTSADCLPMGMCPSPRELAAVAKAAPIREELEAAERVMGLGEVQGRGEAEQEREVG